MPRSPRQTEKLLSLLDILFRDSDEDHPLSMADLLQKLEGQGISAERKSVYADLETLRQRGWDIQLDRRRGYWLAQRPFELAELKLLVDAVQSSKFISQNKSRALIKKLEGLCSRHQAGSLQRQVFVSGRVKTMNEAVLYSIDAIHEAIAQNRQITFRYFDYDVNKQKVFRHGGKRYQVSPAGLLRSDESYYLVALADGEKRHYRVDRMAQTQLSGQPRQPGCEQLDLAAYTRRHFGMFSGEERAGCHAGPRRGGPLHPDRRCGGKPAVLRLAVRPGERGGGAGPPGGAPGPGRPALPGPGAVPDLSPGLDRPGEIMYSRTV